MAPAKAKKVFELMAFFAGYGFNKSHSAAYALVAYQTAWLKTHHPVHFMAAVLTNEKGNTEKLVQYLNECRSMDIEVLPPDVNSSGLNFTVDGRQIRFGLSAIKNAGDAPIRSIVEAREREGRFESMHELCCAVDLRLVNKRVLEALVHAGALDGLGGHRGQLSAVIDSALETGQRRQADREAGQGSLFGGDDAPVETPVLPPAPEWDEATRLSREKASLGFYVTGHPLESFKDVLRDFDTTPLAGLHARESGIQISIAGMPVQLRRRKSRAGEWWASLQLEAIDGSVEVLVFPRTYAVFEAQLEADRATLIHGRLDIDEDRVRVIADDVCPLDKLLERQAESVQVRLEASNLDDDLLQRLKQVVDANRGEAQLYFEVARPGTYRLVVRAGSSCQVTPSRSLTAALEAVVGPERVRYRPRPRPQARSRPRRGQRPTTS